MKEVCFFLAVAFLIAWFAVIAPAQEVPPGLEIPSRKPAEGEVVPPPQDRQDSGEAGGTAPQATTKPILDAGYPGVSGYGESAIGGMLPSGPSARFIADDSIIISWSEKNDIAWGFSKTTGKWTKQEMDPPAKEPPVMGETVAALRGESAIYAYSGQTGRWDVLRLPEGRDPKVFVETDYVLVSDGDDVYTFADAIGRWTSPGGEAVNIESEGDSESIFVAFRLKHAQAEPTAHLLEQFFGGESLLIAGDERTQSLIVRAPQETLDKIESLLRVLDTPAAPPSGGPSPAKDALPPRAALPGASVAKLRESYEHLDQQAAQAAAEYRAQVEKLGAAHSSLQNLKRRLTELVAQVFQARQQLHRAELAEFQQRLEQTRQTIAAREKIQDQIIERRVEELLNPQLGWDGAAAAPLSTGSEPRHTTGAGQRQLGARIEPSSGAPARAEVQVLFREPAGAIVQWKQNQTFAIPGRVTASTGTPHQFSLQTTALPNLGVWGSVFVSHPNEAAKVFLSLNPLPIELTQEELEQAATGSLVSKVLYLPFGNLREPTVEAIVFMPVEPGRDPLIEATKRGTILGFVNLGKQPPMRSLRQTSSRNLLEQHDAAMIGVVSEMDGQHLAISLAEAGGTQTGEEVWIARLDPQAVPRGIRSVGRARIIRTDGQKALARVIQTYGLPENGRHIANQVQPGDQIVRTELE